MRSILAGAGFAVGLAMVPASPWGMPTPTAAAETAPAVGAVQAGVVGTRIGLHPDKTRFVIEVSERVAFQAALLAGPDRVVIDLPDISWPGAETPRTGRGAVRSYHAERTPAGTLRVVLLLAEPVRLGAAFVMPPAEGYRPRLVFDLEPVGMPAAARGGHASAPPPPPVAAVPPPAPAAAERPAEAPTPPALASPPWSTALPPSLQPGAAATSPPVPLITPGVARLGAVPVLAVPSLAAPAVTPPPPKPRRSLTAGKPMVALDPGHGGVDPGATGINGIHEKDITLASAFEVRRLLEASGRYRVMMTREEDDFVPLRERVARARQAGADLFISLHADSIARSEIRGLSIYTQSDKSSDHEAEMLAAKENRADAIGGIDLSHENDQVATILIDLAQRDTRNHSHRFATMVLRDAGHQLPLLPKPDRSAAFAVLTAPDVPSVLIEMGYLSNAQDATLLTQAQHRQRLAGILARAIDGYFIWLGGGRRP
ncbi:MAG: N-acetylmuramoyl-L-alanine amidase [Rhodospirillaceae bacterium]